MTRARVAIVGGSGYAGGELLRTLVRHPQVEVAAVSSRSQAGKPVTRAHPNLRGQIDLKFVAPEAIDRCDLLFLAMPHGQTMDQIDAYLHLADKIVDLSADFRLKNPTDYEKWYGFTHKRPQLLLEFVYGMPELHRAAIKTARWVAAPGCTATSAIIPLKPLVEHFDVRVAVVDSKVGSSAGGSEPGLDSHHPERAGVVRSFKPTGHRHLAEMQQELNSSRKFTIAFSPHAVEMVRGILSTIHVFIDGPYTEKDVWQVYLRNYRDEPFVRIVKERSGLYRYPEPKLLIGTNYCDIGFEKDEDSGRLVIMCAIDNLTKGAAGQAVQCMNLMYGWDERSGLDDVGFHPI